MAHSAADPKKAHAASGGVHHSGSGYTNVYGHALAIPGDHYEEARRRLLANPHLRQYAGGLGQPTFFDDMALSPMWSPSAMWGAMMPWLPPAASVTPADDSLFELALTTSDMMKKIDFIPRMDVLYDDQKKEMVLLADVPGYDKKDITVTEDDGALVIKGEMSKEEDSEQRTAQSKCLMKERRSGYFVRRFQLPKNAVSNGVAATMDKGVLRVNIKLQDSAAVKKPITIK